MRVKSRLKLWEFNLQYSLNKRLTW